MALKLSFSREKLYSKFYYIKLVIILPQTHVNLKNAYFFQVFVQIFEMHIIRKVFLKYMDSVTTTRWEKISWHMLLSFSKTNVLSLTSGSSNHRYENLNCIYAYFYYIIIIIFMYIELWCIITAFQISCNAFKRNKMWWYKHFFTFYYYVLEQNITYFLIFNSFSQCFLHPSLWPRNPWSNPT